MVITLVSLGCPKNQVDADILAHALLKAGHTTTTDMTEADVCIINTCGFITSAKEEAIRLEEERRKKIEQKKEH